MNELKKDTRTHYTRPVTEIRKEDCEILIRLALAEDAPEGDPTSESIFPPDQMGQARVVSNEGGILCGSLVVKHLLEYFREHTGIGVAGHFRLKDGDPFPPGETLMEIHGPVHALLRLERIILNFLQYLSGISTSVHRAVALAGPGIQILDTRKTIPGYRRLAKYAVYCGGGTNHRITLSEMALIKDNHVSAAGGVSRAIEKVRSSHPELPLEIEVDTLAQLEEALPLHPRMVLLDNMDRSHIADALRMIHTYPESEQPHVEVSGGWRPERLHELEGLGPLRVSMGSLTTRSQFLDLSMEIV